MSVDVLFAIIGAVVTVVSANVALFNWLKYDMQVLETKMQGLEVKIKDDMREFKSEIRGWKEEINKEMRDFHGRLCAIEERYRSK